MVGQVAIPATPLGTTLAGKTIIITGGNTGLGYESARQYLILQASRVIITVRSELKGEEAVAALQADPDVKAANPSAKVEFFLLDLGDYESGLEFVQRVKKEVPELDLLLCNGGVSFMNYQVSKSGHERVMQGKSRASTRDVVLHQD
jgi:NAD(P)-dependent dehydrogenase (short-subunit alcohol dehydrogenase family)